MSHPADTQITLRGIPKEVFKELLNEARKKGQSLNKILLQKLLPHEKKEGRAASLLKLAGTWSKAQSTDFDEQIKEHRKIDSELWD